MLMSNNVVGSKTNLWAWFELNFVWHFSIAAFTMFVGITFPFFGGLLGFFGGFAFAPTTYFVSHTLSWIFVILNFRKMLFVNFVGAITILEKELSYNLWLFLFLILSSLVSCGLPSTNQGDSVYLGGLTG